MGAEVDGVGQVVFDGMEVMIQMRKSTVSYIRRFKCSVCGADATAPKLSRTGNGHVKTMYCPVCRRERDFVQVGIDKMR